MENVKVRAVRSISAIRDAIKSKKYNVQKRVIVTERSRRSRVYFTPKQGGGGWILLHCKEHAEGNGNRTQF